MCINKIKWVITCTCIILSTTGCGKTIEQQIAEQLELGQKYFAEQDYEQALVAFNKMIEIDPKQWDAYIGIAEIYEAQKKPDQAVQIMEQGLGVLSMEEVPGEDIDFLVDLYRILADQESQAGDMELTQTYYQKILELRPETEDIKVLHQNLEKIAQYESQTGDLIQAAAEAEDTFDFKHSLLENVEFQEWFNSLTEPVIIPEEDGSYIGFYPGGFIYSGEMLQGMREGHGLWIYWSDRSITVEDTLWEDDKPNGQLYHKSIPNREKMEQEYVCVHKESVTVVDGVYEGNAVMLYVDGSGEICEFDVNYVNGIMQVSGEDTIVECKICHDSELIINNKVHKVEGID